MKNRFYLFLGYVLVSMSLGGCELFEGEIRGVCESKTQNEAGSLYTCFPDYSESGCKKDFDQAFFYENKSCFKLGYEYNGSGGKCKSSDSGCYAALNEYGEIDSSAPGANGGFADDQNIVEFSDGYCQQDLSLGFAIGTANLCFEYTGLTADQFQEVEDDCATQLTSGTCPTSGTIGRCENEGNGFVYDIVFYNDVAIDDAIDSCDDIWSGTWGF